VSQIESGYCADPSGYVGRTLEFLVTAIEDSRRSAVLSRRQLLRRTEEEETRRRLAALKPGDELDGTVARLEAFGAFVDLGGMDGLVHVSEIQYGRVSHPRDVLRPGEKVRVRVLRIEVGKDGRPRIALSIKASSPDPWIEVPQRFAPGMRVKGVVARLTEFGAFVTLAPGIDGLVHVSEITPHRTVRVKDALAAGQEIEAIVLAVDVAKRRISLSIRAAGADGERADLAGDARERPAVAPAAPEAAPPAPPVDLPPTTMAIALREAADRARRKQAGPTS
jgi:small subunit ribosomal protein S1